MSEERVLVAHGQDWNARYIEKELIREGLNVVGVVTNHKEVLATAEEVKPNVLVINTLWESMDYSPFMYTAAVIDGIWLIAKFNDQFPDVHIFVYTATPRADLLHRIQAFATYLDAGEVSLKELAKTIREKMYNTFVTTH